MLCLKKDEWFLQTPENESLLQRTDKNGIPLFRTKTVSSEEAKELGLVDSTGSLTTKASKKVGVAPPSKGIDITGDEDPELKERLSALDSEGDASNPNKEGTDSANLVTV